MIMDACQQFATPIEDEDLFDVAIPQNPSTPEKQSNRVQQLTPAQIKRKQLMDSLVQQVQSQSFKPRNINEIVNSDGFIEVTLEQDNLKSDDTIQKILPRDSKIAHILAKPNSDPSNLQDQIEKPKANLVICKLFQGHKKSPEVAIKCWDDYKDQLKKQISSKKRKIWDTLQGPVEKFDEEEEEILEGGIENEENEPEDENPEVEDDNSKMDDNRINHRKRITESDDEEELDGEVHNEELEDENEEAEDEDDNFEAQDENSEFDDNRINRGNSIIEYDDEEMPAADIEYEDENENEELEDKNIEAEDENSELDDIQINYRKRIIESSDEEMPDAAEVKEKEREDKTFKPEDSDSEPYDNGVNYKNRIVESDDDEPEDKNFQFEDSDSEPYEDRIDPRKRIIESDDEEEEVDAGDSEPHDHRINNRKNIIESDDEEIIPSDWHSSDSDDEILVKRKVPRPKARIIESDDEPDEDISF